VGPKTTRRCPFQRLSVLDVSYEVERKGHPPPSAPRAVNYIVGALRERPGRKSIGLFSDGMHCLRALVVSARKRVAGSYADITVALPA